MERRGPRVTLGAALVALLLGCAAEPPAPPAAPAQSPDAGRRPDSSAYRRQLVDLTILSGPLTMPPGSTQPLTARVMVPPGTRALGLSATPSSDAFTQTLKLEVEAPVAAGNPVPLEVQLPFTPPQSGVYYLDGERRFAIQAFAAGAGPLGGAGSFLDGARYDGAYQPTRSSVSPAATASEPPAPMWGPVSVLSSLTGGAVRGNPKVVERSVTSVEGPQYGQRGQRLSWKAALWSTGNSVVRPDVQERGSELQVTALLAPAPETPIKAPLPIETSTTFSWVFKDRGQYRIVTREGVTLGYVTIN